MPPIKILRWAGHEKEGGNVLASIGRKLRPILNILARTYSPVIKKQLGTDFIKTGAKLLTSRILKKAQGQKDINSDVTPEKVKRLNSIEGAGSRKKKNIKKKKKSKRKK